MEADKDLVKHLNYMVGNPISAQSDLRVNDDKRG